MEGLTRVIVAVFMILILLVGWVWVFNYVFDLGIVITAAMLDFFVKATIFVLALLVTIVLIVVLREL